MEKFKTFALIGVGPPVSNISFLNHRGSVGPPMSNVTFFFFNKIGSFGPRVRDIMLFNQAHLQHFVYL